MSRAGMLNLRKAVHKYDPTYQAYLIGADNQIVAAHIIDARGDDEAAAGARALAGTLDDLLHGRGRLGGTLLGLGWDFSAILLVLAAPAVCAAVAIALTQAGVRASGQPRAPPPIDPPGAARHGPRVPPI